MRSLRLALVAGLLVAVTTVMPVMPVTRHHPVPVVTGVVVALVLALAAAAGAWFGRARTALALAVVGWTCPLLVLGPGSVDVVVVSGIALRLWAGLPELALLGRPHLRDLLPELVGGACAASLVLFAAERSSGQDPSLLLLAAAGVLLVALGSLRLRR